MDNDFSEKLNSILADPAMMDKIKNIAGSLGASAPPPPPKEERREEKGADCENCPRALPCGEKTCQLPGKQSELAKNIANSRALLVALKPFLDSDRCARIDKIIGMMKIAEIMGYIK